MTRIVLYHASVVSRLGDVCSKGGKGIEFWGQGSGGGTVLTMVLVVCSMLVVCSRLNDFNSSQSLRASISCCVFSFCHFLGWLGSFSVRPRGDGMVG